MRIAASLPSFFPEVFFLLGFFCNRKNIDYGKSDLGQSHPDLLESKLGMQLWKEMEQLWNQRIVNTHCGFLSFSWTN